MKHQPAARHSAFHWRDGYQQQIDWTNGKRAALSRIKTAKELVALEIIGNLCEDLAET